MASERSYALARALFQVAVDAKVNPINVPVVVSETNEEVDIKIEFPRGISLVEQKRISERAKESGLEVEGVKVGKNVLIFTLKNKAVQEKHDQDYKNLKVLEPATINLSHGQGTLKLMRGDPFSYKTSEKYFFVRSPLQPGRVMSFSTDDNAFRAWLAAQDPEFQQ